MNELTITTTLFICCIILFLCVLLVIRSSIVKDAYFEIMLTQNEKYINKLSYDNMLFDLTCWTTKQFIRKAEK